MNCLLTTARSWTERCWFEHRRWVLLLSRCRACILSECPGSTCGRTRRRGRAPKREASAQGRWDLPCRWCLWSRLPKHIYRRTLAFTIALFWRCVLERHRIASLAERTMHFHSRELEAYLLWSRVLSIQQAQTPSPDRCTTSLDISNRVLPRWGWMCAMPWK